MNVSSSALGLIGLTAVLVAGNANATTAGSERFDPANFDTSVRACTDFFQYANGGWIKSNPIPDSYSRWGVDNEIGQHNLRLLKNLLEDAAANPGPPGSERQKIGDFYTAAMDTQAIDNAGLEPLKPDLAAIAALRTPADVAGLIIDWQAHGRHVLFDFAVQPDLHNARMNIAYAGQGGLGLPDRAAYIRDDNPSRRLRHEYRAHIARMLDLLGDENAERESDWVLALETRLARASLSGNDLRDPARSYHLVSIADADEITPHFSWRRFFDSIGRGDVSRFSLAQPAFFVAVDRGLATTPIRHWQAWLRWRLIDADAQYLSRKLVRADFDFHGRILRGARQNLPRWKRVIRSANAAIGELLGRSYVAKVLPPETRAHAQVLANNLKRAMRARIIDRDWMSAPAKKTALAKLDAMAIRIGYPDRWPDESQLHISRDSYLRNMRAALAFQAKRRHARIDRGVNRDEWNLTPQTPNAYYNPMRNEIVVPAAQLQPPYFDIAADDAVNYGALGTLIGHEMVHAFDQQGSRFDASGNQRDWWSAADRARFDARAEKLIAQYHTYVPIDDLHIDGRRTLVENLADLGGVLIAYDAFKLTEPNGTSVIDGESPDQQFFLSYARSWRSVQRPAPLRRSLRNSLHAPAKYRVNGPLSDIHAFTRAFSCKADDPMNRRADTRARIW